jgi:hypothetical protein
MGFDKTWETAKMVSFEFAYNNPLSVPFHAQDIMLPGGSDAVIPIGKNGNALRPNNFHNF